MATVSQHHAPQHFFVKFVRVLDQARVPQVLLVQKLHDYLCNSVSVLKSAAAVFAFPDKGYLRPEFTDLELDFVDSCDVARQKF